MMTSEASIPALVDWVSSNTTLTNAPAVDRTASNTLQTLEHILQRPLPIDRVERVEALMKYLWRDVLRPGSSPAVVDALRCADFFDRIGFLFKYKPYGVKIAAPFGYSIFDLEDGEGFSFQIHEEPKLEAFHILGVKSSSLVYMSSLQEWEEAGQRWASLATAGVENLVDPHFVRRPSPGDVLEIRETRVVHAILGCVLEEYASCSVDAVKRLLDQNERSDVRLPDRHPDVAELLSRSTTEPPVSRVGRVAEGWEEIPLGKDDPIVSANQGIRGKRVQLSRGDRIPIDAADDYLTSAVAIKGVVELAGAGRSRQIRAGSLGFVPPGMDVTVTALSGEASVAIHQVTRELSARDWTS
jgi:hypothetical protein